MQQQRTAKTEREKNNVEFLANIVFFFHLFRFCATIAYSDTYHIIIYSRIIAMCSFLLIS